MEYILRNDYATHNNKYTPIKKSYKSHSKYINNGLYFLSVTLQKIFYNSDDGFIFVKNKKYEGLKVGQIEESYQDKGYMSTYLGEIHFNLEILPSVLSASQYNRTYLKLQNILALFRGIFNVILFLCQSLTFILTRGLFFRDIALLSFKDEYYSNKKNASEEFIAFQIPKLKRFTDSFFGRKFNNKIILLIKLQMIIHIEKKENL